jgi:hypothetical protein
MPQTADLKKEKPTAYKKEWKTCLKVDYRPLNNCPWYFFARSEESLLSAE